MTNPPSIVVMGVSGSGKTTVGTKLAEALGYEYVEGDALHPASNVDKMSRGMPLDDADRAPWLAAIHDRLRRALASGRPIVVACSALKQQYRDTLAEGVPLTWVYLHGTPDLIRSRMAHRQHHFMKPGMLESQFDALEEPTDAIVGDIAQPPDLLIDQILTQLRHRHP